MVKFSIVIPTRNCEEHIRDLMESLSRLNFKDFEAIVVDYSTDRTPEIAASYSFAKVIRFNRPGLNAARNEGVRRAKGEYIAFTDGDCVVPPGWLDSMLAVFEEEDADCVGGSAVGYYRGLIHDYANEGVWPVMPVYTRRVTITPSNFHRIRLPPGNNMAFRRRVFESGYMFDEEYRWGSDEVDLLWRICRDGYKIVVDPQVYVFHKHRSTLFQLLKQEYRYGRGHVRLYKKFPSSTLARAPLLAVAGVASYGVAVALCTAVAGLYVLAAMALVPLAGGYVALAAYYASKGHTLKKVLAYPALDFMCHSAYLLGFTVELLRSHVRLSPAISGH